MATDYDSKAQYDLVKPYLISSEVAYGVYGVTSGENDFLVVTDLRIIIVTESEATSIPYSRFMRITTARTGSNLVGGNAMTVHLANSDYSFSLRSAEKVTKAYDFMVRNMLQQEASGMGLGL